MDIAGAALLMCACVYVLKGIGFRGAAVVSTLFFVLLLLGTMGGIDALMSEALSLSVDAGVGETVECALKVIGLGYLFGICADVCRALSENEIAKGIELAGRVEIFLLIFPFVRDIFLLIAGLL